MIGLANSSGPPYEIASTFSLTLLDGREHCHFETSSIHPEINFGHWQAILFPTQQHIWWHLSSPHRCAIFQCHTTPNHQTSWMLDSRRNALRAKRFMRSSSNKVVSSMIFDSKGALITKYDLIPILTCPVRSNALSPKQSWPFFALPILLVSLSLCIPLNHFGAIFFELLMLTLPHRYFDAILGKDQSWLDVD